MKAVSAKIAMLMLFLAILIIAMTFVAFSLATQPKAVHNKQNGATFDIEAAEQNRVFIKNTGHVSILDMSFSVNGINVSSSGPPELKPGETGVYIINEQELAALQSPFIIKAYSPDWASEIAQSATSAFEITATHTPSVASVNQPVTITASTLNGMVSTISIVIDNAVALTCISSPCIYTGSFPFGQHTYMARANDSYGNAASSLSHSFVIGDDSAAIIFNENSVVTSSQAEISWTTSKSSNSVVKYGSSSGLYDQTATDSGLVSIHAINLTRLDPGRTYYYIIISSDSSGKTAQTEEKTFTTKDIQSLAGQPSSIESTVENPWANTAFAMTEDGNMAQSLMPADEGMEASSAVLTAKGFGFSIPQAAKINGIVVKIKRMASDEGVTDKSIRLFNGNPIGTTHASEDSWETSLSYASYGAENDLWGATLNANIINSPDFGVQVSATNSDYSTEKTASIDFISMTVFYYV